jgi:hypothetical protein
VLDAVDRQQEPDGGGHDAGGVDPPMPGRPNLAEQHRCEAEEADDNGEVDQEHRSPPEAFQQHAADDWSDREAGSECCGEDADGLCASLGVGEQLAQNRQRGGKQGRAGDRHGRAGSDEHFRCGGEGSGSRAEAEEDRADHEEPEAPVAVADVPERDEQ